MVFSLWIYGLPKRKGGGCRHVAVRIVPSGGFPVCGRALTSVRQQGRVLLFDVDGAVATKRVEQNYFPDPMVLRPAVLALREARILSLECSDPGDGTACAFPPAAVMQLLRRMLAAPAVITAFRLTENGAELDMKIRPDGDSPLLARLTVSCTQAAVLWDGFVKPANYNKDEK